MKKFLYVALMALTMGFMASCKGGSGAYTPGGPRPVIDEVKGTVNGKAYENTIEKCWKVNISATVGKESRKDTDYQWSTEFGIVAYMEEMMWDIAQTQGASASYSYAPTADGDYNACMSHKELE